MFHVGWALALHQMSSSFGSILKEWRLSGICHSHNTGKQKPSQAMSPQVSSEMRHALYSLAFHWPKQIICPSAMSTKWGVYISHRTALPVTRNALLCIILSGKREMQSCNVPQNKLIFPPKLIFKNWIAIWSSNSTLKVYTQKNCTEVFK